MEGHTDEIEPTIAPRRAHPAPDSPLDAGRIAELRRRVARGDYETPGMAAEVARRMLERGDP